MTDRITKVVIRGDVSGLKATLAAAGNSVRGVVNDLKAVEQQNRRVGTSFTQLAGVAAGSFVGLGIAKVIKDSVTLEAAYSKTMAQVAVATGAPKAELKSLDDLALKLGADTVFSAQDAGSAMLELAKGGLTTAQIKAGALSDTLTLAAAGGLELGDAAGTVVNAMGAFQIKASDTGAAVAALAGAANASSSDVSDITQALAQAGTSAHSAGLSIQETTAYLALFSNQGIKGSDAGTSLRTMLTRLVPQTKQAKDAMAALSLTYVDGNGKLVDATEIAARTQKAFKNLSDEDRIRYANAIFGSDAQRAVNAITAEGAKGLEKYIKQTSDLTQAQKLAKAANSGTSGSIENLKGSIETAEIKIGKGLAPAIQKLAAEAEDFVQHGDLEKWAREGGDAFTDFVNEITPLVHSLGDLAQTAFPAVENAGKATISVLELAAHIITPLVDGFNMLPKAAQQALILAAGATAIGRSMRNSESPIANASAGLLGFGTNARRAGRNAEGAERGVRTLGGSLKGFAILAGGVFAAQQLGDEFDSLKRTFIDADDAVSGLGATFSREGKSTTATAAGLSAALSKGSLGKAAKELHINLDALAADMAKNGTSGDLYRATLVKLQKTADDTGGVFGSLKKDLLDPFGGINSQAANARDALKGIGDAFTDVANSSTITNRAFNQTRNEIMLAGAGIDKYRDKLRVLPTAVVTEITTPGALKSQQDVVSLARQFNLTPKQVETIMKAKDFASKDIKAVLKYLAIADGTTANPHIKLTGAESAKAALKALASLINNLPGVHVNTATPANPTIAHADGGIIRGPGTATSDSIPAYLSDGEYVMRAAAVAKYGTHMFDSLNAGHFATGGSVGNTATFADLSTRELKRQLDLNQKALDKNSDKLSTLKDTMKSFSDTVRDNFRTDGFNQGDENTGASGLTALRGTLATDAANAREFGSDLKKLKAKGISAGLYNALAASGDLQTARELASQSRSQIDDTDSLYVARQRATSALGTQAGTAAYGAQVSSLEKTVAKLTNLDKKLEAASERGTKAGAKAGIAAAAASGQHSSTNRPRG